MEQQKLEHIRAEITVGRCAYVKEWADKTNCQLDWLLDCMARFKGLSAWDKADKSIRQAHLEKIKRLANGLAEEFAKYEGQGFGSILGYLDEETAVDIARGLAANVQQRALGGTGYRIRRRAELSVQDVQDWELSRVASEFNASEDAAINSEGRYQRHVKNGCFRRQGDVKELPYGCVLGEDGYIYKLASNGLEMAIYGLLGRRGISPDIFKRIAERAEQVDIDKRIVGKPSVRDAEKIAFARYLDEFIVYNWPECEGKTKLISYCIWAYFGGEERPEERYVHSWLNGA